MGHAVWCARKFIGNEPFAVLLGDDIVQAETPCLRQLMDQYEGTQSSVIGVQTVPENETHRYGIIDPIEKMNAVIKCVNLLKTSRRYSTIKFSNYGTLRINARNLYVP